MTIYGVAILAFCTLIGVLVGDALGILLGVKANVGGVGVAMLLLVAARWQLLKRGLLKSGSSFGIEFWGSLYIPIVVAMAAQQNVVAAVTGGPMVLIASVLTVAACLVLVATITRLGPPQETMDEIEERLRQESAAALQREIAR